MQLQKQTAPPEAFARREVLAILAVLTLLATIIMPALAGSRRSTDGAACANNLRQIGHAYQLWGANSCGRRSDRRCKQCQSGSDYWRIHAGREISRKHRVQRNA